MTSHEDATVIGATDQHGAAAPDAGMVTTAATPAPQQLKAPRRWRRGVAIGVSLAVVAAALATGWFAAEHLQSPDQRAADAAAPSPLPVVVAVRSGVLQTTTTAQTTIGRASAISAPLTLPSGAAVVTATPAAAGSTVSEGSVLLEVSGRPVIALAGTFPFYRDLSTDATGPDVRQLQDALIRLGLSIPRSELGTFGDVTTRRVIKLYRDRGYDAALLTGPTDAAAATEGAAAAPAQETPADGTTATPAPPARTLITVPASDLLVATSLPTTLGGTPAAGARLTSENATVTFLAGDLVAGADLDVATAGGIPDGSAVVLSDPAGTTAAATVSRLPAAAGAATVHLVFTPTAPLPAAWEGTVVLATITMQTVGTESLIVPTRAVTTAADGSSTVLVQRSGAMTATPVTVIGELAGQTAIAPTTPGAIAVGDMVEVR